MDVTIIIPVNYNRGWLDDAIQSALNQDYKGSYEIILASDGNPELKKYADKYKIKFSLANRKNLSHTINVAMEIAKGKFIKGLAEDDLLTSNCLRDLMNCIGDYAIVYARSFNFRGNMQKVSISNPPQKIIFKDLWKDKSSFIHGGTVLYRRDIFMALGGRNEKLNSCEEYDFYLNLLAHGYRFIFCDFIVYKYRMHDRQKSRIANSPARMIDKNYIYNKYKPYIK